jgi:hypothetical protein
MIVILTLLSRHDTPCTVDHQSRNLGDNGCRIRNTSVHHTLVEIEWHLNA